MSARSVNTKLRLQQRAARDYIETVRLASGNLAADCYVSGLLLGIAEYMIDQHGRRAAFNYFAGFTDDIITPDLP